MEPTPARVIRTKAVGVTFRNEDGSRRQALIRRRCKPGSVLRVVHEPDNPEDENAIGLWADGWLRPRRIGYLKSGLAADLVEAIEGGARPRAVVIEVTGGGWFRARGVNLEVTVEDAPGGRGHEARAETGGGPVGCVVGMVAGAVKLTVVVLFGLVILGVILGMFR